MFDFRQSVYEQDEDPNQERIGKYIDSLMAEFVESPEAQPIREKHGGCGWTATVMEFSFDYLGVSPAEMTRRDFEEVVFTIIPEKISTEAEAAEAIVDELRAFWNFAARQYGAENARSILAALDGDASRLLHEELANPANYGMAKSIVMTGMQSGFNMADPNDAAAFIAAFNARVATSTHELPSAPSGFFGGPHFSPLERPTSDEIKKQRKIKRKQREAKRRNRSR